MPHGSLLSDNRPEPEAGTTWWDDFAVVNAAAGAWRCVKCNEHTSSPSEHRKVCPARPTTGESEK